MAQAIRSQLIPWLVVAVNVVSLYISNLANDSYTSYALSFDNDCGHLVTMPLLTAFVMWLAVALPIASIAISVAWSRHRRRAQDLPWFPVRGAGIPLVCLAILVAALCFAVVWFQPTGYHVFCSNV